MAKYMEAGSCNNWVKYQLKNILQPYPHLLSYGKMAHVNRYGGRSSVG